MTMESWHVVGQKVTLLSEKKWQRVFGYDKPDILFGKVYTVSEVGVWGTITFFILEECKPWNRYDVLSFRPVRPTSIECFRSLLSPTPSQVRELKREREDA